MKGSVAWNRRPARWALALAVLAAGCAHGGGPAPTAAPSLTATAPTPPAQSAAAFDLSDPTVGLAALDTYAATLTLTFAGIRSGEPLNWTDTYALAAQAQPAARLLTITPQGDLTARVLTILAEIDGTAYSAPAGQPCVVAPLDPAASALAPLTPAAQLLPVSGAQLGGADAINGQPAQRYTFDAAALGAAGQATAAGAFWLAADGGYVLRYTLTVTGTASFFPSGAQGVYHWDYALTAVNQPVRLAPPTGCSPG